MSLKYNNHLLFSGFRSNSKQWYEEPLFTLTHNNVQKLYI